MCHSQGEKRMHSKMMPTASGAAEGGGGCAFVLEEGRGSGASAGNPFCNANCQAGSPYCPQHHRLCHLKSGSDAERRQLCEMEALAQAVGGRQGRPARSPPDGVLRHIERLERVFLRLDCSRIVLKQEARMTKAAAVTKGNGKTVSAAAPAAAAAGPTPERAQHGPVERLEQAIGDAAGQPSRPYRAPDTLHVMERRGSITAAMRQAGEDFRARFAIAQLDPLRATDLSRLRVDGECRRPEREAPGLRIETARRAVWLAIQAVGGIASPAGSCLWHVLGWQRTLKEWAIEQGWAGRRVSQEAASGILVAALGALETHFAMPVRVSSPHFSVDKSGSM
jgi:hypothetical protein